MIWKEGDRKLFQRSTGEIIVVLLTISVCIVIVLITIAVVVGVFFLPKIDFIGAARVISSIINTVIGALIGYMAGTRYGRNDSGDSS